jgi:hypothetical protein
MFSTIIVFCGRIVNDKFFATMKTRQENRQIVVFCAGKGHILLKNHEKIFFSKEKIIKKGKVNENIAKKNPLCYTEKVVWCSCKKR